MNKRFKNWKYPEFDEKDMTKWNWMCQHKQSVARTLKLKGHSGFTCIGQIGGI